MTTYADVLSAHDIELPAHLVADAEIPVVSGKMQRQGDVAIIPMRAGQVDGLKPIPAEGIVVVRGESGGNTHLLVGSGRWAPNTNDRAVCGTLMVEEGEAAYLTHPEHGGQGIGEGSYIVRRQVEQAEELRIVAD